MRNKRLSFTGWSWKSAWAWHGGGTWTYLKGWDLPVPVAWDNGVESDRVIENNQSGDARNLLSWS